MIRKARKLLFPERLIEADTLRPSSDGFITDLRLPWYRALPLSCIERMEVRVDGQPVPEEDVTLTLAGKGPYTLPELAAHTEDYWYVLDSAQLSVKSNAATQPGEHAIDLAFGLYIPYLPVNGAPLKNLDSNSAILKVADR
ncbi:MAG: C-glycoside deglycosidase beta subunit domain-containing protein [Microbacterium sp.]|uniref:C-glycoside deglycosidase beta subunit domain-containing protein n=1 Tax=Microbacterium sp. TaxID=51671 RepID=UPI003F7D484A